jgi:hypothetical protein
MLILLDFYFKVVPGPGGGGVCDAVLNYARNKRGTAHTAAAHTYTRFICRRSARNLLASSVAYTHKGVQLSETGAYVHIYIY